MRSVTAILLGMMLAFAIALLIVFGIFAPLLSVVFGMGQLTLSSVLPLVLLTFASGFAFYWGGMAAGYRAKHHRPLHGALVGVVAIVISPVVNTLSGNGPFPGVDTPELAGLVTLVAVVSISTAYIGGLRGEALYNYNQQFVSPKKAARSRGKTEPEETTAEEAEQ